MNILTKIALFIYICNIYTMEKKHNELNLSQSTNGFTIIFKNNLSTKDHPLKMSFKEAGPIDEKIALWKEVANSDETKNNLCTIIKNIPDSSLKLAQDRRVLSHYYAILNEINNFLKLGILHEEESKILMVLSYIRVGLSYPNCSNIYSQDLIQTTCSTGLKNKHDIKLFIDVFKDCDLKKAKFFAAFFLFYLNDGITSL